MVAEAAATRSPDIVAALLEAGTDLPEGWRTWAERQRERAERRSGTRNRAAVGSECPRAMLTP